MTNEQTPSSIFERTKAAMERLIHASKELNEASAPLEDALKRIQELVNKLNLGVPCAVKMGDTAELFYEKGPRGWGFYVTDVHNSETQYWPLFESPRYLRIRTVDAIPSLLEHMHTVAQSVQVQLESAAVRAKEIVAEIEAQK